MPYPKDRYSPQFSITTNKTTKQRGGNKPLEVHVYDKIRDRPVI